MRKGKKPQPVPDPISDQINDAWAALQQAQAKREARAEAVPPIPGWEGDIPEAPIDTVAAIVEYIAGELAQLRHYRDLVWASMTDRGRALHSKRDLGLIGAAEVLRNAHRVLPMLGVIPPPEIRPDAADAEVGLQMLLSWLAHRETPTADEAETADGDPVEEVLSGQALALYRFLRGAKSWTHYETLRATDCFWRNPCPEDSTIFLALRKLQAALSAQVLPLALKIEHKSRRCRLS